MAAAQDVRDTLNNLLHKVREGGRAPQQAGEYDDTCDSILGATDRLFKSMGNAGEMVKQAKILALVSRSRGCVRMREPPAMFGQRVVHCGPVIQTQFTLDEFQRVLLGMTW